MSEKDRHGKPWSHREIAKLGAASDREVAVQLGRTAKAVETQRRVHGVPAHNAHRYRWSAAEIRLIGKMADARLAQRLGLCRRAVMMERRRRGIAPACPQNRPKWLSQKRRKKARR